MFRACSNLKACLLLQSDVEILVTGTEEKLLRAHLEEQEFLVLNRKPRPNKSQRTEENTDVQVDDTKPERDQSDCDLYADVPKPPREAWLRADTNSEPANSTGNIIDSPSGKFLFSSTVFC